MILSFPSCSSFFELVLIFFVIRLDPTYIHFQSIIFVFSFSFLQFPFFSFYHFVFHLNFHNTHIKYFVPCGHIISSKRTEYRNDGDDDERKNKTILLLCFCVPFRANNWFYSELVCLCSLYANMCVFFCSITQAFVCVLSFMLVFVRGQRAIHFEVIHFFVSKFFYFIVVPAIQRNLDEENLQCICRRKPSMLYIWTNRQTYLNYFVYRNYWELMRTTRNN